MTNSLANKDFYKADIYRFDIESSTQEVPNTKYIPAFDVTISNVISWDLFQLKMTKEELKGLADFINKYLENN